MVLPKKGSLPETIYCPERSRETNNFFQGSRSHDPSASRAPPGQVAAFSALVLLTAFSSLVGFAEPMRDIT